ncbi:urea amidolyase related protein [Anopheles sinensis]|uniref:Urea amidolyase related protein n=1 Tax=Anopheles sinensis TaxID=74873 RepID=A0A084VM09_ANOSI|nr:urea amidolyase related protein [Anopheles sinensis]
MHLMSRSLLDGCCFPRVPLILTGGDTAPRVNDAGVRVVSLKTPPKSIALLIRVHWLPLSDLFDGQVLDSPTTTTPTTMWWKETSNDPTPTRVIGSPRSTGSVTRPDEAKTPPDFDPTIFGLSDADHPLFGS